MEAATTPLQQLWRQVILGAGIGLAVGVALGALFAVVGFPEWTVTAWSFVGVLALIGLPMSFLMRLTMHGVHRYVESVIPKGRRRRIPEEWLTSYWWGYVAGAAALAAYLVLLGVFAVGNGLTTPF